MRTHIFLVLCVVACVLPTTAVETQQLSTEYISGSGSIGFEIWIPIVLAGFIFFILSMLSTDNIVTLSVAAMVFLLAAVFASPFASVTDIALFGSGNTIFVVVSDILAVQPWFAWLLYGLAAIAFVNMWRGVLYKFRDVEDADDTPW